MPDAADPLDEAPTALSLGMVNGGGPTAVTDVVMAVAREVKAGRGVDPSGFGLNVIFHVPGPNYAPDFDGVRLGRVAPKRRAMISQVAVPPLIDPGTTRSFVVQSIEVAIELSEGRVAKRGFGWSSAGLRATLQVLKAGDGAAT